MKNINLESTSFSEQLGLYDFFNVLIYGATFVCGIGALNNKFCKYLWENLSFQKGIGIVLLIYITGMLLQELGSAVDKYLTKLYKGMHRRILKGNLDKRYSTETTNDIIKNPVVLERYRYNAKKLLEEHNFKAEDSRDDRFENEFVNGYIFSISQYYVSIKGKDKKVEKLRALFDMSITLMTCFFLLGICAFGALIFNTDMSIAICSNLGFAVHGCEHCLDKLIMIVLFLSIGTAFLFRAKRTMRNFLLILLGTYNAILDDEEREKMLGVHAYEALSKNMNEGKK